MIKPRRLLLLAGFFAGALAALYGEVRWYSSNAAGMALEPVFSRLALRGKYALSIEPLRSSELPENLRPYHNSAYQIELHILYENGTASRRQWLFKDGAGRTRVVAAFDVEAPQEEELPDDSDEKPESEDEDEEREKEEARPKAPEGFVELYNEQGLITEDHRLYRDGIDHIVTYIYSGVLLIRAETREKKPESAEEAETLELLYTDSYRYTRSSSLRAVERVFHKAQPKPVEPVRLSFPHVIVGVANNKDFVSPGSAYSSEFLEDILIDSGSRIVYTTDDRGRVLVETRRDEDGTVLGELRNTWVGDRLAAVHWKSGEDDRLTEYEYDEEGDRILERNYNKGVLERTVRREGDQEIEELYMNGQVILRAIWEEGRKVREDRIRPSPGEAR